MFLAILRIYTITTAPRYAERQKGTCTARLADGTFDVEVLKPTVPIPISISIRLKYFWTSFEVVDSHRKCLHRLNFVRVDRFSH